MSCRHNLAGGTCARCYPETGTLDPGPEDTYLLNLEGPGAVTQAEYRARPVAVPGASLKHGPRVKIPEPGDTILVKAIILKARLSMPVTQVANDYIVCGSGLGTRVVRISDYGENWWWPNFPP